MHVEVLAVVKLLRSTHWKIREPDSDVAAAHSAQKKKSSSDEHFTVL